jgi:hypothetical protein
MIYFKQEKNNFSEVPLLNFFALKTAQNKIAFSKIVFNIFKGQQDIQFFKIYAKLMHAYVQRRPADLNSKEKTGSFLIRLGQVLLHT